MFVGVARVLLIVPMFVENLRPARQTGHQNAKRNKNLFHIPPKIRIFFRQNNSVPSPQRIKDKAMNKIVEEKIPQLVELCKKYRVERMYLFGSAARDDFDEATSDFDFLVSFSGKLSVLDRGDNFLDLVEDLEKLFGRDVDLMTEKSLSNPYLVRSINQDKKLIYEAA
jgi:predicted nucleotidyltransferase